MEQPGCTEKERLSPKQLLLRTELDLYLSHASSWVRVGFADAPSIFSLTTPKRLLCIDSRTPLKPAQELLNLSNQTVDLQGGRSFNPFETFVQAQPQWFNDTYALLATDFNIVLVDKRLPERTVLKWSQPLRGPPTYAKFVDTQKLDGFPAEVRRFIIR